MAAPAVLHSLRHRSASLQFDFVQSKSGHKVSKIVSDRIQQLKDLDDLQVNDLVDECKGIIELAQAAKPKVVRLRDPFISEFLEFLASGDISSLAPAGTMSPEVFKATHDYIFCHVTKVSGRTISAVFHSNKTKFCGGILAPTWNIEVGPAIILRQGGLIQGVVQPVPDFDDRARLFNSVSARSKV